MGTMKAMAWSAVLRVGMSLVLLPLPCLFADDPPPAGDPGEDVRFEESLTRYRDNPDVLVLPGLKADRGAGRVTLEARALGLGPSDPVEFFLIGRESGHGYEALATSMAGARDLHRALEFIGMEPGHPVDRARMRFWPKGERVIMWFRYGDPLQQREPVRAESLILDQRTEKPLAETGLVFTGSRWLEPSGTQTGRYYAADAVEPHALASTYNESTSVLDVPRQEPQSEVYGFLTPNPEQRLPAGERIDVILEPEHKDGTERVLDLCLLVKTAGGTNQADAVSLKLALRDGEGRGVATDPGVNGVLARLSAFCDAGRDVFLSMRVAPDVSLAALRRLCAILAAVETEHGVRMEPPLPGHLYYKAWLPGEEFRDRRKRVSQPWELHLSLEGDGLSGTLVELEQVWKGDSLWPEVRSTDIEVDSPAALRRALDARGPGLPVILVFAPSGLTHGALLDFLAPVLSTHGTIHVFLEEVQQAEADGS